MEHFYIVGRERVFVSVFVRERERLCKVGRIEQQVYNSFISYANKHEDVTIGRYERERERERERE